MTFFTPFLGQDFWDFGLSIIGFCAVGLIAIYNLGVQETSTFQPVCSNLYTTVHKVLKIFPGNKKIVYSYIQGGRSCWSVQAALAETLNN